MTNLFGVEVPEGDLPIQPLTATTRLAVSDRTLGGTSGSMNSSFLSAKLHAIQKAPKCDSCRSISRSEPHERMVNSKYAWLATPSLDAITVKLPNLPLALSVGAIARPRLSAIRTTLAAPLNEPALPREVFG